MTDLAQWQANNDQYLGLALQWLRLRLARLATGDNGLGDEIAAVAERMASVTDPRWPETPPPALRLLGQQFGLSSFEEEILLLCAGLELDTGVADLCAQAQGNPGRNYPTFALALALFDDPVWEALAPEGPLRFWHLLEIHQPAGAALTASALRADERIVNYLKGLNTLDDRLDPFLYPFVDAPEQLPPSQTTMVDEILTHLRPEDRRSPVIQLLGADSASKQLVAQAAADRLRLQLYRLPVNMLPDPADELNRLQRLWQREAALLPVALYIDSHHAAGGEQESSNSDHQLARLDRFLARQAGICFVAARDTLPNLDAPSIPLEVDRPTPAEQREAW
ncbi:MAG TPA: ATP-binding protein, partial [Anaerolineae bacterium]|nr:ATP-binding protein [Anaerolineae bacterium]